MWNITLQVIAYLMAIVYFTVCHLPQYFYVNYDFQTLLFCFTVTFYGAGYKIINTSKQKLFWTFKEHAQAY